MRKRVLYTVIFVSCRPDVKLLICVVDQRENRVLALSKFNPFESVPCQATYTYKKKRNGDQPIVQEGEERQERDTHT
jgi:hypothetical protein